MNPGRRFTTAEGGANSSGASPHLLLLLALLFTSCSKAPPPPPPASPTKPTASTPWFEEVGRRAGIDFVHTSGHRTIFYNPEIICGGVGLLDYDGDGRMDIFCVQGGSLDPGTKDAPGPRLYRNLGSWRFEDVTDRAGLTGVKGYGMGLACADMDNDGDTDVYLTQVGRNVLFRNNGNGTFTDVTAQAGVATEGWSASATFVDYDRDGHLDLFVTKYINWTPEREVPCFSRGGEPDYCGPTAYNAPTMDRLFHNRGDGTFEDVSLAAGLDAAYGNGLGVSTGDFNRDGWPDIYVANDAMPNQLWINQGNGRFKDEAMMRGCAVNGMGMTEAGMGVVAVDLTVDGWLDLFVTHLGGEANRLFANSNGIFSDLVMPKGPGAVSWPYTGFGIGFQDFDNDGRLDLFVANGKVRFGDPEYDSKDRYAEPNNLLKGLENGKFEEVMPQGGTQPPIIATSRAAAFGDLDDDGAIDIVVLNKDGPLSVLHNLAGGRGNWIKLTVLDARGRLAVGAMVRMEAEGRWQARTVQPNEGYCASHDPRLHFGLGQGAQAQRIVIRWLSGEEEAFGPLPARGLHILRQGTGTKNP
jgi:hypothetical protein